MKPSWWTKPRGGAGWLAMGGIAAGMAVWWPFGVAASAGWIALSVAGYSRSRRALAYLANAFPDATRTYELGREHLEGVVDDMPFRVTNNTDTVHVVIGTPLSPSVSIVPRDQLAVEQRVVVGDPAFDAKLSVLAVDAESELAWRAGLTADTRALLVELFAPYKCSLRDGWLDAVIDDDEADGPVIERMIREGAALGIAMASRSHVDDPMAAFVEQIAREPELGVRMGHYEWLVGIGYEVPAVLHLAARDPADEIRAWAQSQRPVETLYR